MEKVTLDFRGGLLPPLLLEREWRNTRERADIALRYSDCEANESVEWTV